MKLNNKEKDLEHILFKAAANFNRACNVIGRSLKAKDVTDRRTESYSFIAYSPHNMASSIIYAMNFAKKANPQLTDFNFLDVGCGFGNVVATASLVPNIHAHGIEYMEAYVQNRITPRVTRHDAFEYNEYREFEIIYLFRPLIDKVRLHALTKEIIKQAKRGTIILCAGYSEFEIKEHIREQGSFFFLKTDIGDCQFLKVT